MAAVQPPLPQVAIGAAATVAQPLQPQQRCTSSNVLLLPSPERLEGKQQPLLLLLPFPSAVEVAAVTSAAVAVLPPQQQQQLPILTLPLLNPLRA